VVPRICLFPNAYPLITGSYEHGSNYSWSALHHCPHGDGVHVKPAYFAKKDAISACGFELILVTRHLAMALGYCKTAQRFRWTVPLIDAVPCYDGGCCSDQIQQVGGATRAILSSRVRTACWRSQLGRVLRHVPSPVKIESRAKSVLGTDEDNSVLHTVSGRP
jgi:hypothetical protein